METWVNKSLKILHYIMNLATHTLSQLPNLPISFRISNPFPCVCPILHRIHSTIKSRYYRSLSTPPALPSKFYAQTVYPAPPFPKNSYSIPPLPFPPKESNYFRTLAFTSTFFFSFFFPWSLYICGFNQSTYLRILKKAERIYQIYDDTEAS